MQPYIIKRKGKIIGTVEASNVREAVSKANIPIELGFFQGTASGMLGSEIWEVRPLVIDG